MPKHPASRRALWFTQRGYALATTLSRLGRFKLATMMTLLVIGISMSLPALFVFLSPEIAKLSGSQLKAPGLTTYLSMDLDDLQGAALAQQIGQRDDVTEAIYVSRDEALALLQEKTELSPAVATLGENPLPGSIIVQPAAQTRSVAAHRLLASQLEAMPEISRVQLDLEWVERVQALGGLIKTSAFLCALVLVLASLMVIANTIRLELLRYSRESEICSLLGANPSFTRRPFLYLGAVFGLAGAAVGSGLALVFILLLATPVGELAHSYGSSYQLQAPGPQKLLLLIGGSMLLGILAAALTLASRSSRAGTL